MRMLDSLVGIRAQLLQIRMGLKSLKTTKANRIEPNKGHPRNGLMPLTMMAVLENGN